MFPYGRSPYGEPPALMPEQFSRAHPSPGPTTDVSPFPSHPSPGSAQGYPYNYENVASFKDTPSVPETGAFETSAPVSVYQSQQFSSRSSGTEGGEGSFQSPPVLSQSTWPATNTQVPMVQQIAPTATSQEGNTTILPAAELHRTTEMSGTSTDLSVPAVSNACLTDVLDFNFELPRNDERSDRMADRGTTSSILRGENPSDSESDVSVPSNLRADTRSQPSPASTDGSQRNTPTSNISYQHSSSSRPPSACSSRTANDEVSSKDGTHRSHESRSVLESDGPPSSAGSQRNTPTSNVSYPHSSSPRPQSACSSRATNDDISSRDETHRSPESMSASENDLPQGSPRSPTPPPDSFNPLLEKSDQPDQSAKASNEDSDGHRSSGRASVASNGSDANPVSETGSQSPKSPIGQTEKVPKLSVLAAIAAGKTPALDTKEDGQSAVLPVNFPEESAPSSDQRVPGTQTPQAQGKVNSGWMIIDNIRIPYIMHSGKPFVPVRIVEKQLLSCYPSKYPEELRGKPPLPSKFVAQPEADQLSQMCATATETSSFKFTTKDLLVEYGEFNQFYSVIKKHFPGIKPKVTSVTPAAADGEVAGGWLQINNTVIPYLFRTRQKFVPLQVLKFAAGLNTDSGVVEVQPTQEECDHLNTSCKKAGLKFNFTLQETRLVSLMAVRQVCIQTKTKISMLELPKENPLSYARYNTNLTQAQQQNAMGRMIGPRGFRMPGPGGRGMVAPGMNVRGGLRYSMQGRYPYQIPVRSINSIQNRARLEHSDVCVLHHVQRVEFKGKIITCLVRESDKEKFALVEAVSKLYFPDWELYDFRNALCNALRIPIYELTNEEEQAFISSYGLPIKHLNCKLAVRLRELDRFMPQLRYIFEEKKQMAAAGRGKRPAGQMMGGSPFKRAVPRGYAPIRPGQMTAGRGMMMYRQPPPANGRMGVAMIRPAPSTITRPPRRRPKYDNVVIEID